MKLIFPLRNATRTTLYVTDTTPIVGVEYGSKLPDGTVLQNRNEKIAYDISGLYLVDYTLGDRWCEGSVIVAK
ncbi:MAG TPA: hypothetical protein GXX18_13530 [Bacillales bacterium]|nr:hypothetical protein [Bacillales bacterium]